jgi:predicted N-acetyltransferase YhbS
VIKYREVFKAKQLPDPIIGITVKIIGLNSLQQLDRRRSVWQSTSFKNFGSFAVAQGDELVFLPVVIVGMGIGEPEQYRMVFEEFFEVRMTVDQHQHAKRIAFILFKQGHDILRNGGNPRLQKLMVEKFNWERRFAEWVVTNQANGASRTFVVCDGNNVVGYYALASGAISTKSTVGSFRRNMPDPVPVVVLGRLAVNQAYQGRGIGRAMFRDCAQRVSNAADIIGISGIIVHAVSEVAKTFYLKLGFDPSPIEPMTLMIRLTDIRASHS